ncbi:phosphatidate cytidylyltransferase [Oxalobacteraceae bacterium]|nr:phosphatidate cytidylyltransferase [Oxalobacteraceae bacterium]
MLSTLVLDRSTLMAMLLLYLFLAAASVSVGIYGRPGGQLRQQVNSWWLIFPVFSASLLIYPLGPWLLALFIAALALRELALHVRGSRWTLLAPALAVFALLLASSRSDGADLTPLLAALLLAQTLHFLLRRHADQLLLLLFVLLCCSLSLMLRLQHLPNSPQTNLAWIFYLFVLTSLNDVAQFISGTVFGKQKIAARISPNKTWQGLAGGVLASALLSLALGHYLHLAAPLPMLALALLLSLGGFCGDLLFSAAKRYLGIKDFSQLIPGHGGILDRVDSLVLTAPLLYFGLLH